MNMETLLETLIESYGHDERWFSVVIQFAKMMARDGEIGPARQIVALVNDAKKMIHLERLAHAEEWIVATAPVSVADLGDLVPTRMLAELILDRRVLVASDRAEEYRQLPNLGLRARRLAEDPDTILFRPSTRMLGWTNPMEDA